MREYKVEFGWSGIFLSSLGMIAVATIVGYEFGESAGKATCQTLYEKTLQLGEGDK